jgi:murein DD-endopeptidase MepM/ murein hydrolase activator NlpD
MAPGVVEFAGVDLQHQGFVEMPSANAEELAPASMGPRGLFVRVRHEEGLQTLYVHLQSFSVRSGQKLERGELLGRVGRSGMHTSDAHLHLGIFVDEHPIDPLPVLGSYVIRADRGQPNAPPSHLDKTVEEARRPHSLRER